MKRWKKKKNKQGGWKLISFTSLFHASISSASGRCGADLKMSFLSQNIISSALQLSSRGCNVGWRLFLPLCGGCGAGISLFVGLCVAYNVFYAPHKSLVPYLQLALLSPPLRTCNSWPFSLVNYLHVKQWIKMMALRKMLLILREKKHISSWDLLPEACLSSLLIPSHPEKETLSFFTRLLHLHGEMFLCLWF